MSGRRVLALYGALLLGFAAVVCRLYWLCSNTEYAVRAAAQSEAVLRLPAARGNFYDCGGLPLTGISQRWLALCFPGESSYARLYPYADADGQARLYRERNTSRPFLLDVVQDVSGLGVRCYAVPRRYAAAPLAEQLIGYLDSEGHGAAGLEAALDDVLYTGERDTLHCAVTAQGRLRRGSEPILEKADSAPQGVRLTLSRSIQRAAEGVAAESMATGCILIIDAASGKVRACVSLPDFDAANVGESLTAPDSPLLNRAFSAYTVGSVFKPVLAAAALEAGEGDFTRECPGYDALNGQVYRCAGSVPHGLVGLDGALEKSCNGYFIELGRELGPERVRQMAAALGFGKGQDIAGGLRSASGVLPEAETLENEGQFANFCFGQGELLATPLQVAGMMNTIAAYPSFFTSTFIPEYRTLVLTGLIVPETRIQITQAIKTEMIFRLRLFASFFFMFCPSFPYSGKTCCFFMVFACLHTVQAFSECSRCHTDDNLTAVRIRNLSGLFRNNNCQCITDFTDSHTGTVTGSQTFIQFQII